MARYDKIEWTERHLKRLQNLYDEGASVPRMMQALPGFSEPKIKAKLKELGLSLKNRPNRSGFAEKTYG